MAENVEDTGLNRGGERQMTVVRTANGEIEARVLKSVLEGAGIAVELQIEAANKVIPVTVDGLGAVKILVPADRLEEARTILDTPAESIETEDASD